MVTFLNFVSFPSPDRSLKSKVLLLFLHRQLLVCDVKLIVTGFAKRGHMEDHNFVVKWHIKLKLSPAINLCWYFLLTDFQVDSFYQSDIANRQSWWIGCVWRPLFTNTVTISVTYPKPVLHSTAKWIYNKFVSTLFRGWKLLMALKS